MAQCTSIIYGKRCLLAPHGRTRVHQYDARTAIMTHDELVAAIMDEALNLLDKAERLQHAAAILRGEA